MPDVYGGSAEKGPQASLAQGVGLAGTEGREGGVATVPKAAPERLGSGWGSLGPGGGRGTPMPWSLLSLRELIWICNLVSTHPLPLFTHYLTPLSILSKSLLRPGMIRQIPMHPAGPSPAPRSGAPLPPPSHLGPHTAPPRHHELSPFLRPDRQRWPAWHIACPQERPPLPGLDFLPDKIRE